MDGDFRDWDAIDERTIIPGYRARFMHSANMTFAMWTIDAGSRLPLHSHPHEQVSHVLEGEFELTVETATTVLKAGSVALIPSHALHSGRALTMCRILDTFCPVREDYLHEGAQSVLRRADESGRTR